MLVSTNRLGSEGQSCETSDATVDFCSKCRERGKCKVPSLINATSEQLLQGLDQGDFTSVDLVEAYIRRSNEVNPSLHVIMEVNPDALSIAEQCDQERAKGQLRGPLHGLPILIKGNIGTKDRMQTNAGSYALEDTVLPADSTVVAKIRASGLIILGKTSLTEWSMFRAVGWPHSWNAITGHTYGAYYDRQCPNGSSSGSAVAADLGLAWASIGTETSGSIVLPSERNNIVGIKPTVGLTSRYFIVPVSERQDTVGPMARTVMDVARLLQVIAGPDQNDPLTSASPLKHSPTDYLAACKKSGLKGKRIGIARNVIQECRIDLSHIMETFECAIHLLRSAGAIIVEHTDFTAFGEWKKREYNPIPRAEFAVNIARYLDKLEGNPNGIRNIEDIREFTRRHPKEEYPTWNTAVWDISIDRKVAIDSSEFQRLYERNLYLGGEGGILGALQRHQLDAVVLPTAAAPEIPALVGTPIISVPMGAASDDTPILKDDWGSVEAAPGIPFGISFLGAKWSEEILIEIAYAFEQKTLVRNSLGRVIQPCTELHSILKK